MDFLLETISLSSEYDSTCNGSYPGSSLNQFLNTILQNKKGINKLESWIRPMALNLVVNEVQREMDNLKELLTMKIAGLLGVSLLTTSVYSPYFENSAN
jgi:hypothetical protein